MAASTAATAPKIPSKRIYSRKYYLPVQIILDRTDVAGRLVRVHFGDRLGAWRARCSPVSPPSGE
jgi:hypothetical protein